MEGKNNFLYTLGEHSFIYRNGEWYYNNEQGKLTEGVTVTFVGEKTVVEIEKEQNNIVIEKRYQDGSQERFVYDRKAKDLKSFTYYNSKGDFVYGKEYIFSEEYKEYGAFRYEWKWNEEKHRKEGTIYSTKDGSPIGYGFGGKLYITTPDSYTVYLFDLDGHLQKIFALRKGKWYTEEGEKITDEILLSELQAAHRERYYYRWLTGEVSLGKFLEAAGEIIPAAEKALMPGLSGWIAKQWRNFKEWREAIDKGFAKACLGEEYWKSEICDAHLERLNKQTLVIESPAGEVQFVAHVEAERSSPMPKECPCKADEECIGGICYKDGQPLVKYFYKITYGVRAPSDIALTPEIDERGAVSFTLKLEGEVSKYVYVIEGTQKPYYFHLKPGEEKSAVGDKALLFFSTRKYDEVCIKFGKEPKKKWREIKYLCNKIAESQRSYENWREAALSGAAPGEAPAIVPEFNPDI